MKTTPGNTLASLFCATLLMPCSVPGEDVPNRVATALPRGDRSASPAGTAIPISEAGFEANGTWMFARNGSPVQGFFSPSHDQYVKAGFIDAVPGGERSFAYNNGPDHDLYQVLETTVAANTTYGLRIVAIDATFANPFPGGRLRLGYVPGVDAGTTGDRIANDFFGECLLRQIRVDNPVPANGAGPDDSYATWTTTFTTGPAPAGLGKPLRIEILGGGHAQSIFDNVRLAAAVATAEELRLAASPAATVEPPPVVVMFGDSTTERGLPAFVEKKVDALLMSGLRRPTVVNAGKGYDNATSALTRLEADVLAHDPDIVTVSFGLNDTGARNPEKFGESLAQITERLKKAGAEVVLITSTPFNNDKHDWAGQFQELGGLDEYMDREFCRRVRRLANDEGFSLCDLHSIFREGVGQDPALLEKVICGDGVHLTDEGRALAAEHIARAVCRLLSD